MKKTDAKQAPSSVTAVASPTPEEEYWVRVDLRNYVPAVIVRSPKGRTRKVTEEVSS